MIKTRLVKDCTGKIDLVETYSDEDYKLLQAETNITYGKSVVDLIEGYDKDNNPYSRYTYQETSEKDEEPEVENDTSDNIINTSI